MRRITSSVLNEVYEQYMRIYELEDDGQETISISVIADFGCPCNNMQSGLL